MKEQEGVPRSRKCLSANRKMGHGNYQSPAEHHFPEARKPKYNVFYLSWWHWFWSTAYTESIGMWQKPQCFLTHMHPFPRLGKGLKREKIWIKGHPYCCHPSSLPSKSYSIENNFEDERGLPNSIYISGGTEPLMWLPAACPKLWLNRLNSNWMALNKKDYGKRAREEERH